ncbi:MAG TPA: hypothetical protein VF267_00160 [Gammaproteobacteria bacterium]
MHAEIRQLIAFRDGEPADARIASHVRGCARCTHAIAELARVQSALRDLPPLAAPSGTWEQVVARRELETNPATPRSLPRRTTIAALAAVISVAVIATLLAVNVRLPREVPPGGAAVTGTAALQQRSRELEFLLARYRSPGAVSLRTADAISELEDSIAMIDYQLNVTRDGGRQRELWRQRVALMETLITVRAAENYLDSI